jgi:hypothetical protein
MKRSSGTAIASLVPLLATALLLLSASSVRSQITKVSGKVQDALTNEPVPFANVAFKGTLIGSVTDINGNFSIETEKATDSLTVSSGYTWHHQGQGPNC